MDNSRIGENIPVDIIRTSDGRFITIYGPSIPGSYEQAISDISSFKEAGSTHMRGILDLLKQRKAAYDTTGSAPVTIDEVVKNFKGSRLYPFWLGRS